MLTKLKQYIYKGHERTVRAKKNILMSFILKGINIFIQLLLVPLLLNYLSPLKYGIWLTLSSVINWFYFFDIGLGNGLRNKLAEAFAKNDKNIAKIYVSTTYATLSLIVSFLYLIFLITYKYVNWQIVFNVPDNLTGELNRLILIVFTFFALNFIARLISSIVNADQKSAINDIIFTSGNLFALFIVYIISEISTESLVLVGLAMGSSVFIPTTIATFVLFKNKYHEIIPSLSFIKLNYINELTSLGLKFFIMQIAAVVVFTTDNIIITQLFGPAEVTPYNIALKYFNIIQMGFSILITPFWSAFTEAYQKNDVEWIKNIINKLLKIWGGVVILVIIMILCSGFVYTIWIGNSVKIPFSLSVLMGLFVIIATWSNIFAFFINGVGKLKISLITATVNSVINIPLSVLFAKYMGLGINGVILGTCISLSIGAVLRPLQSYKIINNKAYGVWNE